MDNKSIDPEKLLLLTGQLSSKQEILKLQELIGELDYLLEKKLKPQLPELTKFLINNSELKSINKTGLKAFYKHFNLNRSDIQLFIEFKTIIKSFLFTSRQLIDQQLVVLRSLKKVVNRKSEETSINFSDFIIKLNDDLYKFIDPRLKNYFLRYTFLLIYIRFVRNNVKTIHDLKAELFYTVKNTEIIVTVKAEIGKNEKLLKLLLKEKDEQDIQYFNFKIIEIFEKTVIMFKLFNNTIFDLLSESSKKK